MKKLLLIIFGAVLISSCGGQADADFQIHEHSISEGKFYPSLAIFNSHHEDPSDFFYFFGLNAPKEGAKIKITLEATELNEETIITETATEAGEMLIYPVIKWKYDVLANLAQSGTTTMTCILEIDGKEAGRINNVIRYRPINECVYGYTDPDTGEWNDIKELFAMYVNEDYPGIDKILQEILSWDRNRQFLDYQGSAQDFFNQLIWVWDYFSRRGTRYSNVVSTSNATEYIGSQYVRFIDQTLNNAQANCVDGSALLASIYRKIGLDVYLIFVPGHCKLAVYYPKHLNLNGVGQTDPNEGGMLILETTLMGSNQNSNDSFTNALEIYTMQEFRNMEHGDSYFLPVSIKEARKMGFMPIPR